MRMLICAIITFIVVVCGLALFWVHPVAGLFGFLLACGAVRAFVYEFLDK